ncbi:hypothetical protein psal_cds_1263 [Pandoravirus salinus]|uniref:Uncharacterized protein n=1 Tax=Pandoravirus salinus TaxID=1349410 RepID=S4W4H8_9VIRU|nr:hypothetical protein psal_cds_1263 [Pandoravirus salinus]AGO85607.1 hypothetical protein psal_cds_1263 [Pandoravirus salinus]
MGAYRKSAGPCAFSLASPNTAPAPIQNCKQRPARVRGSPKKNANQRKKKRAQKVRPTAVRDFSSSLGAPAGEKKRGMHRQAGVGLPSCAILLFVAAVAFPRPSVKKKRKETPFLFHFPFF